MDKLTCDRREFFEAAAAIAAGSRAAAGEISRTADYGTFEAAVLRLDRANGNKRIYPKSVMRACVADNPAGLGRLWHDGQEFGVKDLSRVSHRYTRLRVLGDYVTARIELLHTPCGDQLREMIKNKAVVFRTSGIAGGTTHENGVTVIGKDYRLVSIDAIPVGKAARL